MCVCVHSYVWASVCACVWRPEATLGCHLSDTIHLCFWDRVSHWLRTHLECARLVHSPCNPPVSVISTLSYRHVPPHPTLYVGSGRLNPGPHIYVASTLPIELSPSPNYLYLYRWGCCGNPTLSKFCCVRGRDFHGEPFLHILCQHGLFSGYSSLADKFPRKETSAWDFQAHGDMKIADLNRGHYWIVVGFMKSGAILQSSRW